MANHKRIYTVASANGFNREYVHEYISFSYNKHSTKDLTSIEEEELLNHLQPQEEGIVMADKTFAKGMIAKAPREGAPDFVIGSLSIKSEEFVAFLNEHTNDKGWVNLDILKNKTDDSKFNVSLNDYVKKDF